MSNNSDSRSDTSRRTVLKLLGATGVAATGVGAFGGSAAADSHISVSDDEESYPVQSSEVTIQQGNPNAVFQSIDVNITDIDEEAGTVSGTVSGTVLPNANANKRAARSFDVAFDNAPVTRLEEVGNPTELIRLEIPDLFLDILGLQISLDLELLVEADPEGGLLGRLLDALLG